MDNAAEPVREAGPFKLLLLRGFLRKGFPGKNREILLTYSLTNIKSIGVKISEGLNPKRIIYLCLKDERKIPLTPINKPITLSEIETEASDLAKFLNIKLENKTKKMISLSKYFSYIRVNSELESLLLEASLVKKFNTPYNIELTDQYVVGKNPPSFDKKFLRDWLGSTGWNKQAPGPVLPDEVVTKTAEKYREALARLAS